MIFRLAEIDFPSLHDGSLKDGRTILQGVNVFVSIDLCIILKDEACFWKNYRRGRECPFMAFC